MVAPAHRARTAWRRWGYRLLPGDVFSYLLHLRPAEWPIMAAHTALGYVLAAGLAGVARGDHLGAALLGLAVWVVFLNGGTLALNSVFDRDQGDIGYLRAPPPVPARLFEFSLGLLVAGGLTSLALPPGFRLAYGVCFVLSVLYSVPPFRFKAVAGVDWVINMVGFGTITPYALWAVTGRPLTAGAAWVLAGFCPLFAGLYPLTQLYQLEEDRARGDRTLALILGLTPSLAVALGCTLAAFACFGRGAVRAAVPVWPLAMPLAAWLAVLGPWIARRRRYAPADHQRGMYRALAAWAVTDVTVLLLFAR